MKKTLALIGSAFLLFSQVNAQKLEVKPTGRILFDGGIFNSKTDKLTNGVAIPDLRMGFKAAFGEYHMKFDMKFAHQKLSLKDCFIQRKFSKGLSLQLGYFGPGFGFCKELGSSFFTTMQQPIADAIFSPERMVGLMFTSHNKTFFSQTGLFVKSDAALMAANKMPKGQGLTASTRLVYRPLTEKGSIFHIGLSALYETPNYKLKVKPTIDVDKKGNPFLTEEKKVDGPAFSFAAKFPTKINKGKLLGLEVEDAKSQIKLAPELLAAYQSVAFESQFYWANVTRGDKLKSYNTYGFLANVRALLLGGNYAYNASHATIKTPGAGSLEAIAGYSFANLTDKNAKVLGGKVSGVNVGLNYYFNKYVTGRLTYSYAASALENKKNHNFNALQFRVQFKF